MAERVILIILIILVVLEFLMIKSVDKRQRRQKSRYDSLLRGSNPNFNIEQVLLDINQRLDDKENQMQSIEDRTLAARDITKGAFNRISLVHYNANPDLKNDLSFSLCMLDSNNNGIILTSIYGPDYTKVYAKEVFDGKSSQDLSDYERDCLQKAIK